MAARIEDYALLGDGASAALVSRDGAIDWLCWPGFSGDAVFAALLGGDGNGCWRIAPRGRATTVGRRYLPGTMVLETRIATEEGEAVLLDWMAWDHHPQLLLRRVLCTRGRVRVDFLLKVCRDYGRVPVPALAPAPPAHASSKVAAGLGMGLGTGTVGRAYAASGSSPIPAWSLDGRHTLCLKARTIWPLWKAACGGTSCSRPAPSATSCSVAATRRRRRPAPHGWTPAPSCATPYRLGDPGMPGEATRQGSTQNPSSSR